MSKYTAEQVRACILTYKSGDLNYCRSGIVDLLTAYAERIKADEGAVTDGVVRAACRAMHPTAEFSDSMNRPFQKEMRAALLAVWPNPPAQAAQVDGAAALAHFTDYFVRNYPGPNTIIYDPKWHAPKIFRAAQYAIANATTNATTTPPSAEPVAQDEVAEFGHHPDPAIDFCVEVEALLGEIENHRIGFENGTPPRTELDARIEHAMSFRVGGDTHAVRAKQQLRAATAAEPVAQVEVVFTGLNIDGTPRYERLAAQPRAVLDPETACAMWVMPTTTDAEIAAFLAGARAMLAAAAIVELHEAAHEFDGKTP